MKKLSSYNQSGKSTFMVRPITTVLMKKLLITFSLFFVGLTLVSATDNFDYSELITTVSGTITDESGAALVGVSVLEKGTSNGTISDIDGTYNLSNVADDAVIVYSFVGMATQEVSVAAGSSIDVIMASSSTALDEIVVTGYTTRKRGELTGSVSSVSAADIERTSNKDVVKSLAGKVTGLIVADRGGAPGNTDNVDLLIRGKSTLGNNAPLILIDGLQSGSFAHLSPADIASISILKDGSAAIYGARAANGVILITTKRGKDGKPVVNFTNQYSIASFSRTPNLMSSEQYAIYVNEADERAGNPLRFSQDDINKYAAGNDAAFPSTNWSDLTFANTTPELRSTLSVSGASDNVKYFVSGDYLDQQGVYASGDLNFKQYQLRSNLDIQVSKRFKLGVDLAGRFGTQNAPGVDESFIYKHIYTNEPTELAVNSDGSYAWGGENGANPVLMSSNETGFNRQVRNTLTSKLSYGLDLDFITEGLTTEGFLGYRRLNTDTKNWYTAWEVFRDEGNGEFRTEPGFSMSGPENILNESFWKFDELMLNATIRYNRSFDDHSISGFVGYEQFTSDTRNFNAQRRGFPSDNHPELFAGSDDGQISSGRSSESARLNYFGSLSYNYQSKYFLDLTLRRDGSSNFGPGNRFGTFPGIALAWSIGQEGFMQNVEWLNALKLRASWAQMGNDRIAPFQFLTRYNFGGGNNQQPNYYTFGTNGGTRYLGYQSANTPNPDITWEKADMKNIGLSFALADYKLTGDINYFYQKRTDILIQRNASIPDVAGLDLPQENLGKVDNFGWEFELGWRDKIGDVGYNLGFNFTHAKNRVVFLDEAANISDQLKREGFPIDSYVVYPTNGIFASQAAVEAASATLEGTVAGEPAYIDTNGDGAIDGSDRVRVYSSNVPEIQFGFLGGFSFKQFDLNFLFQGQAKAEMVVFFDQSGAKPEHVFNQRWTPQNTDARYPRAFLQGDPYSSGLGSVSGNTIAAGFQAADIWLHDASFVRLKEIELGYSFNKEQVKFGDARIFVRGFNLLTMFSDVYDLGLDPEGVGYDNFRYSRYPSLKSFSFGVNLTF